MNREIKFRRAHFDTNGKFMKFTFWGKIDGSFLSPAKLSDENAGKAIDEQLTGLKDKNGTEIYEGDMCKSSKYPYHDYIVTFENGAFNISDLSMSKLLVTGNTHDNE